MDVIYAEAARFICTKLDAYGREADIIEILKRFFLPNSSLNRVESILAWKKKVNGSMMFNCYNGAMSNQDLSRLYGSLAPYSDHKVGESIRFRKGTVQQGTIIWVTQPGQVVVEGGRTHGVEYIVDTGGFPEVVTPGQIVVE